MEHGANIEGGESRNDLELVNSVSDRHLGPSSPYISIFKEKSTDIEERAKRKYTLIRDGGDDFQTRLYDKPLTCFGCGIGWFSFLLGFLCPLMWYYATFFYFGNYYRKDPRERAGLAASAIAALGCSLLVLIFLVIFLLYIKPITYSLPTNIYLIWSPT